MDARPTAEHDALRATVAALARDHAATTVRDLGSSDRTARLISCLEDAGLYELRDAAGSDPVGSSVDVAIVAEELAHAAVEAPYIGRVLAADLLSRAGASHAAPSATVAIDSDLGALAKRRVRERFDHGVAIDAAASTSAVLVIVDEQGLGLAQVPIDLVETASDLTRPIGKIDPDAVPEVVAMPGSLLPAHLESWRAFAHALLAADLVGSMRAAHSAAVIYATQRKQYGRAVGSFQAVQHLLADSIAWLEGSISVARYAAWAADAAELAEARHAGRIAKAFCAEAARVVCETAIQVHGGIGNTWECMVHVHLRRALLSIELLGTDHVILEELAAERLGDPDGVSR